jgi:putative ATP-dependent endonuclease of OLD family
MHLCELKLWNFRKYGIKGAEFEKADPGVVVHFNPGLNVLIGENDSGKSSIVDAIRYVLGTQSREWVRYEKTDFHESDAKRANKWKIECIFRGITHEEAGPFLEWLGFEEIDGKQEYVLKVRLAAELKSGDRVVPDYLRAGPDAVGSQLDGEARDRLRATYLKPLRDADNELTPGQRSRFAQILKAHKLFQKNNVPGEEKKHPLETFLAKANEEIDKYFTDENEAGETAGKLMGTLNGFLEEFFPEDYSQKAKVKIARSDLSDILQRLELLLADNPAGLGTLNLLYIAAELLLLQNKEFNSLRLGLIEELEAHLHPQAQLRLIHFLQKQLLEEKKLSGQYILTTHSTTLGASIDLKNLLICRANNVFPMGIAQHGGCFTYLEPKDYEFLYRFLDATKANLFFAKGVILVEGDAENLLIPTIAECIGRPLHRYDVSIVNVGSTAFSHYERVFLRKNGQSMGIKVAVVTDLDVNPFEYYQGDNPALSVAQIEEEKGTRRVELLREYADVNIKCHVSPNWTLEYEIALSPLRKLLYRSILWAEKKQNAKAGLPKDSKVREVRMQAIDDFKVWNKHWGQEARCEEKIAFEIYQNTLLLKGISKAITAQEFAACLQTYKDAKKLRDCLLEAPSLQYLIQAIQFVTKPI